MEINEIKYHLKQNELINIIKVLLYKDNPLLLEKLDFNNQELFLEPLLFAYFNNKKYNDFSKEALKEILFDQSIYTKLPNTKIKLLTTKQPVLRGTFKTSKEEYIPFEKIEISETLIDKYYKKLSSSIAYLQKYTPKHFECIEQCCIAITLFKTDPKNTNSFATINAHGMAFFNVYQEDYDEVFFVDDIAHQTGHVIMNTFWFDRKEHFIINENDPIKPITQDPQEYRSFFILFHALYTYYTSILCLENCIDNNCFNKKQESEATARIGFYLKKYVVDIKRFEKVCAFYKGVENVLKTESQHLYLTIKDKYYSSYKRWIETINTFSYKNQPYNFTFSIFESENQHLKP